MIVGVTLFVWGAAICALAWLLGQPPHKEAKDESEAKGIRISGSITLVVGIIIFLLTCLARLP